MEQTSNALVTTLVKDYQLSISQLPETTSGKYSQLSKKEIRCRTNEKLMMIMRSPQECTMDEEMSEKVLVLLSFFQKSIALHKSIMSPLAALWQP